jgi:hypothetical protein
MQPPHETPRELDPMRGKKLEDGGRPKKAPRATAKGAALLSRRSLVVRRASPHGCDLASRISEANRVVAAVNLPLIDRGFVLHRKAHGQKGTVPGYPLRKGYDYEPVLS